MVVCLGLLTKTKKTRLNIVFFHWLQMWLQPQLIHTALNDVEPNKIQKCFPVIISASLLSVICFDSFYCMLCLKRVTYLKYVSNYVLHVLDLLWEKDFEVCAVQLHLLSCIVCIITIYTSPSGNFSYFLKNLEPILNSIYSNSIDLIISEDLNINYLNDNYTKQLLDSLLASHYLYSTV